MDPNHYMGHSIPLNYIGHNICTSMPQNNSGYGDGKKEVRNT